MNNNTRKIVSYLLATMTIVNSQSLLINQITEEKASDSKVYEEIKENNREIHNYIQYEPYSIENDFKPSKQTSPIKVKKYYKKK